MTATLIPSKLSARMVSMQAYLKSCSGRDVLRFDSQALATDAARLLRERHPDIEVSASYDRVTLTAARSR